MFLYSFWLKALIATDCIGSLIKILLRAKILAENPTSRFTDNHGVHSNETSYGGIPFRCNHRLLRFCYKFALSLDFLHFLALKIEIRHFCFKNEIIFTFYCHCSRREGLDCQSSYEGKVFSTVDFLTDFRS